MSPAEAAKSFQLLEGYRIELVAAEPLVTDPVAFAFDARARLFVIEMRDYSEQETERLGRLALLEDTDGDGRMDKRTTYVEGLSWPTAVWPWRDGALVAEPPFITWYRDVDQDGVSDLSENWFIGFGRSNVQGLVNSLRWGVDGLLHGATSSTGAELEQVQHPERERVSLRRRDFAIDPLSKIIRETSGGGQHGLSFNRWGDKFVTSNSDHLQQVIDLDAWLESHPTSVSFPAFRRSIAEDGPQAPVFRASPIEPWRIVRTRLRVGGVVPGPIEGGGTPAGYFTGATGTWIVDGESGFSNENCDVALVCDVGSNLVHRKRMVDQGLFWTGQRMDEGTEFLRSTDTWFRPVQLGDGPDGALYIADMYREVIEHPKSLPPVIKRHLDLTSGRDRGRIWRVIPTRSEFSGQSAVDIHRLSKTELIDSLSHPIAWRRRAASQLLIESGVENHVRELRDRTLNGRSPEAQILGMHILSRLGQFDTRLARSLLDAKHPRVLEHAIRLTGVQGFAQELLPKLMELAQLGQPRIQLELGLIAADLNHEDRIALLESLLLSSREPMVRATLVAAAGDQSWRLIAGRAGRNLSNSDYATWLQLALPTWIPQLASNMELREWVTNQLTSEGSERQELWLNGMAGLARQADVSRILESIPDSARSLLREKVIESLSQEAPEAKYAWLRFVDEETQTRWIGRLLEPNRSEDIQRQAVQLIEQLNLTDSAEILLSRFSSMTPKIQSDVLRLLTAYDRYALLLLDALKAGELKTSQMTPEVKQRLEANANRQVADRARELLGAVTKDRQEVIERYAAALEQPFSAASIASGRKHFEKACAQCHQVDGIGNTVGAALKQLNEKTPRQLLEAILDPNREVDPRYSRYSVLLDDDRSLAGLIQNESANQLVLVEAGGREHTIQRNEIAVMVSNGTSLMPEGIEDQLTPTELFELICFLRQAQ